MFYSNQLPDTGWNEAIVAKLCGENDRKIAVLSPQHGKLSGRGELLDRYG